MHNTTTLHFKCAGVPCVDFLKVLNYVKLYGSKSCYVHLQIKNTQAGYRSALH